MRDNGEGTVPESLGNRGKCHAGAGSGLTEGLGTWLHAADGFISLALAEAVFHHHSNIVAYYARP